MNAKTKIRSQSDAITHAAGVLVSMVRMAERAEKGRSSYAELSVEVELTGGGTETWTLKIERTASSH
jgi:hypothetical protein